MSDFELQNLPNSNSTPTELRQTTHTQQPETQQTSVSTSRVNQPTVQNNSNVKAVTMAFSVSGNKDLTDNNCAKSSGASGNSGTHRSWASKIEMNSERNNTGQEKFDSFVTEGVKTESRRALREINMESSTPKENHRPVVVGMWHKSLVSAGHLCDLSTLFVRIQNLVTIFVILFELCNIMIMM